MNKSDLRKLYLEERASLSQGELILASDDILERFFSSVDLACVSKLHTFIRIARFNEIDTSIVYQKCWRDWPDILTVAPRADLISGEIESVEFDSKTEWRENRWGIPEPVNGETVSASAIDLVIVPLLCFDESGHRVGYG